MSSTIYLIHRCPYCHVNITRPGLLRDHLEKQHTLKCDFTNERRKATKEITFVTEPTANSQTCFSCCFCKMFFDDETVFKMHIENDHVITTVIHSHNRRSYSYDIKDVSASTATIETEENWIIDDLLVSNMLHSFRDQVVIRHDKGQALSDSDLLALDYIFPFAKDVNESTPIFTGAQHKAVITDIEVMQDSGKTNQFAIKWCSDLAKMDTPSWRDVKLATAKCICTAVDTDNDDDLLAAEIIHALSGRLIRNNHEKHMLEDSFAHQYLDPILETIFGSDECLRQEWANDILLPMMKRKRNDNDSNTDVDNSKDAETVYKPDWAVFANGNPVVIMTGTLELKVSYMRNPGCVSDYVKLAKEMKLVLHQLIHLGVIRPIACGILIQGMSEIDTDNQHNK
ncbi:hypothetical protein CLU79DRAFT_536084 [Phycomyces nitens]|nr:hypothetical protein CLU79DRAFT_536084 [Phycomyces nitens]